MLRTVLRIPGGKVYQSKHIVSLFNKSHAFISMFAGGLSELWNKPPSPCEIVFEVNPNIYNFYKVLQTDPAFPYKMLEYEYNEKQFFFAENYENESLSDVARAAKFLIRNRMSRDGMMEEYTWSDRLRGGLPEQVNSWKNVVKRLPDIAERLKHVKLLNENSIDYIDAFLPIKDCVIFADPPYLHSKRVSKKLYGKYELTEGQHVALLDKLSDANGQVILCGYDNDLYNSRLTGWKKHYKNVKINMGNSKSKSDRIEVIWEKS